MNKAAAIRAILAATGTQPVIFTGEVCRIARTIADRPNHFYLTPGSMGLASAIGIGVAMHTRRTTVVVDEDGSLLTNPVGLLTAGTLANLRLIHVVLEDSSTAAAGSSASRRPVDLCALATAAGYPRVCPAVPLDHLTGTLRSQIDTCDGPVFIHCGQSKGDTGPVASMARTARATVSRLPVHRTGTELDRAPGWLPEDGAVAHDGHILPS